MEPNMLSEQEKRDEKEPIFHIDDVEQCSTSTPSTSSKEEEVIGFDLNDPEDPHNWALWYKWSLVILISILSLIV
jgi:hypothetical protein